MKTINLEKVFTILIVLLSLTLFAFISIIIFANVFQANQQAAGTQKTANIKPIETYEYIVTKIDSSGLYGNSTKDQTGIYLTNDNIKNLNLSKNDLIKVSFPENEWDVITKVEKVKNN